MAKKKKAPRWQFTYGDKEYTFDVGRDLTMARLKQIKQWYPNLGAVNHMVVGLVAGDPEAWSCAIWSARKSAGELDVPEPNRMKDFSVWDMIADEEIDEDEDEQEEGLEGERPTSSPSTGSERTSTPSEGGTSDC